LAEDKKEVSALLPNFTLPTFNYAQNVNEMMDKIQDKSNETFMQLTIEQIEKFKSPSETITYLSDIMTSVDYDLRFNKRAEDQARLTSESSRSTDEWDRFPWSEYARENLPDFERLSDKALQTRTSPKYIRVRELRLNQLGYVTMIFSEQITGELFELMVNMAPYEIFSFGIVSGSEDVGYSTRQLE
jgi:hypothetical protein